MLIGKENLDLKLTLMDSAQCFRWQQRGERFGCVLNGQPVWLWRDDAGIHAEGDIDVDCIRDYLDLNRDYSAIAREYAHIPQACRAVELYPGLRVLNQPPWETLISFIISSNNNVSRIRNLTVALSIHFGTAYGELYAFPTPEQLSSASEDTLRALKVGYRAPYLIGAARRVCEGFPLDSLKDLPYEEAHGLLVTLPGVGDKVADCVLLFGCRHASAFPVDVWVDRLLRSWFGIESASRSAMRRQARALLGPHAGLMQQFLFHSARMGDISLEMKT